MICALAVFQVCMPNVQTFSQAAEQILGWSCDEREKQMLKCRAWGLGNKTAGPERLQKAVHSICKNLKPFISLEFSGWVAMDDVEIRMNSSKV
jgi:hypothetical protein